MARRITHNETPDSLKKAKQHEDAAKAAAKAAEQELDGTRTEIASAITRKESVDAELATLEENLETKTAQCAAIDVTLAQKEAELKKVEGELAAVTSKVVEAEKKLQVAESEHTKALASLSADHQSQIAAYAASQAEAQRVLEESKQELRGVLAEINSAREQLIALRKESAELDATVKPEKERVAKELEELNHQVLVKKVELKDTETALAQKVGEVNDERVKLDEARALRNKEETRVAELHKQLIEKEDEVEGKMRSLRTLQQGVDQATVRLERRQQEFDLQQHLAKTSTVNSN